VAVDAGSRLEHFGAERGISRALGPASLTAAFLLGAAIVGALATFKPVYAVGLVLAVGTAMLVASHIEALPPVLVFTMYAESVTFGGVHIGRLVGLFAIVAIVYYLLVRRSADLQATLLLGVATAEGIWILFSTYWASDHHFVYLWFFRWALSFAYMLAFAVLIRERADLRSVLVASVLAAVAFGSAALAAYAQGGDQGAEHRGSGLQADPNLFAAYQVLAVAPALTLAGLEHRWRLRLAYYAAAGFIILSVGASFSRGGLIALGAVVGLIVLIPSRLLFRGPGQKLACLVVLGFGGWLVGVLGSTQYLARIQTILHGSDRGTGRLDLWSAALRAYSHHPWLGLGAGGFEARSFNLISNTPGVAPSSLIDPSARPVHNAYIEVLSDLGPIGLTLFAALLVLTLWYLVSAARSFGATGNDVEQRLAVAVLVSYASILVASIFLSFELGKSIWIFVGLALALRRMALARARTEALGLRSRRVSDSAGALSPAPAGWPAPPRLTET